MAGIQIHWKVSYLQEVDYEVYGDGPVYRISLRWAADPYFRSIYNGDEDRWQREIVASVGLLHSERSEMVKPEVLDAFRRCVLADSGFVLGEVVTGWFNHDPAVRSWVRMEEPYAYNPTASDDSWKKHYHCYMDPVRGWCCDPIKARECAPTA